jgi:hypothetical protein
MTNRAVRVLLLGLLLTLAGCGSQRGDGPRQNRAVLHAAEMEPAGYADLFQVIQSLRPEWLRPQGATSFRGQEVIVVYLDDNRMGGVEALRNIPPRSIASVRFISGLEASQRWGLNHGMGAIVVSTR